MEACCLSRSPLISVSSSMMTARPEKGVQVVQAALLLPPLRPWEGSELPKARMSRDCDPVCTAPAAGASGLGAVRGAE